MEIKPVVQIRPPAYPTQDELLADKKTLQECLPCRWRKAKGLAGALTLLLAANLTGCGDATSGQPGRSAAAARNNPDPLIVEAGYWIRSIFRGRQVMLGCVAMMPPAVLQEDAAAGATGDSGQKP
jgi:hypothetical protein